ncbi:MAG: PaaI family thioesterase [Prevotella sp.]|nr:PaaI family thioesterase [Prevotella sp.]
MNIDKEKNDITGMPTLATALGMRFYSTDAPDTCRAEMDVDSRTRQPFGVISGGATLALAETLAGLGSLAACPGKRCAGISVTGHHMKAVEEGDTVVAVARLIHRGHKIHVWNVDVTNNAGELVSSVSVTNYITSQPNDIGKKK